MLVLNQLFYISFESSFHALSFEWTECTKKIYGGRYDELWNFANHVQITDLS